MMQNKRQVRSSTNRSKKDKIIIFLGVAGIWAGIILLFLAVLGLGLFDIARHILFTIYLWKHL
jgi:hypothetical protein